RSKCVRIINDAVRVRRAVDLKSFDLVHVLVEPYLPVINILSVPNVVFNIVGTYAVYPFQRGVNQWLYRRALKKVRSIISISDYTAERFMVNNRAGIPVHTIPLGVDNGQFAMDRVPSSSSKQNAFSFVGEIKPRKGLLYVIRAIERLRKEFQDVRLYVVGDTQFGGYADECQRYVDNNDLGDNVRFMGHVTAAQLRQCYRQSLANVLPSVNEHDYFEG
ncbi:MAG: glycosyltransferase, partial [Planctomycetes bacterium]|nr:glycosyltransferase [Planctomycetota bacterium]